jgi:hypothetical protein
LKKDGALPTEQLPLLPIMSRAPGGSKTRKIKTVAVLPSKRRERGSLSEPELQKGRRRELALLHTLVAGYRREMLPPAGSVLWLARGGFIHAVASRAFFRALSQRVDRGESAAVAVGGGAADRDA